MLMLKKLVSWNRNGGMKLRLHCWLSGASCPEFHTGWLQLHQAVLLLILVKSVLLAPAKLIAGHCSFSAEENDLGVFYHIIVFYHPLEASAASMRADKSENKLCSPQVP